MTTRTRYYCRFCKCRKLVPESPQHCPNKIRTGCDCCGALTPHHPVGQPEVHQ